MSDGRLDSEWNQTSHLMAMITNILRDPDDILQPADLNPREQSKRKEIIEPKHEVGVLKSVAGAGGKGLPVRRVKASEIRTVEVNNVSK